MPLYTYTCTNGECKHTSDKLVKLDDRDSPIECSKCGSTSIRVISLTAPVQFKGSGWTEKFHKSTLDNSK